MYNFSFILSFQRAANKILSRASTTFTFTFTFTVSTECSLELVLLTHFVCFWSFYFLLFSYIIFCFPSHLLFNLSKISIQPAALPFIMLSRWPSAVSLFRSPNDVVLSRAFYQLCASSLMHFSSVLSRVNIEVKTLILKCWLRGTFYLVKHQTNRNQAHW